MNIRDYTREALTFDTHYEDHLLDALGHGLSSEVAEAFEAALGIDRDAQKSELGDVMWELAMIAHKVGIDVKELEEAEQERCPANVPTVQSLAAALVVKAGKVSGQLEKRLRKNRPAMFRPHLMLEVVLTWQRFTWLVHVCGFTMAEIRESNLTKLTQRYQERGIPRREAS